MTGLRCWLRGHSWRASIVAASRVLVSCRRCTTSPDLIAIADGVSKSAQARPAATILYDLWAGRPLDQTVTVDTADIFAVALVLLGYALKPGEDPRRILDVLTLAHLDPDRNPQ